VNARAHAEKADRLLELLAAQERELGAITPERELELAVGGGFARLNADRRWMLELAVAHSLTALALRWPE